MFAPHLEPLEPRQFLSGSNCDADADADADAPSAGHDARVAAMLRPLGYTYPDGGGGTGGGGTSTGGNGGSKSSARDFSAKLRGSNEVPARSTTATGKLTLRLNRAGTSVSFKLKITGLRNVVAAHLHLGGPNVNGPVVAHLYGPQAPGGGLRSGKLAGAKLKATDLTGSLEGKPFKALVKAIKKGNVYVNVHTDDGVGSSDTAAGDFASGEIRGQVKRA
jgi:hypothetical protein